MRLHHWFVCALAGALVSCGGGGGGGSAPNPPPPNNPGSNDRVSITATASTTPVPSHANTDLEIVLTNPSTVPASNVAVSLTLGGGLTIGGVQCTANSNGLCPNDPTTLSVASLNGGGSLTFRVSVVVAAGASGQINSTASVTATNDTVTNNNSAAVSITAYSSDVNIVGSSSATNLLSGSTVPYSFTLTNSGPDSTHELTLENTLSTGQMLVSMTCAASGGATCPAITGATMNVASMPNGGSLTFSLSAQVANDVVVSVNSQLSATLLGDGNITNNQATASAQTRIPTSSGTPSFIVLQSDAGEFVGSDFGPARKYSYSNASADFEVYVTNGLLQLTVWGDERWQGAFYMPVTLGQITAGTYIDNIGAPQHDPATGGMRWTGEDRGCNGHTDVFTVDAVTYSAGEISSVDISFEQHCESAVPALRGQIHWVANDATLPPGPVNPPPAGLWQPAAGATPASGNYLYFISDPGDFAGEGTTRTFTQVNSVITAYQGGASASIGIGAEGDEGFGVSFRPMSPLTQLAPGYYSNAVPDMGGNPVRGGMNATFNHHGCNTITGWFVIDSISFSVGGDITSLDARFEQHCEGAEPAMRGKIHWRSDDPAQPPGPEEPPPAGLWSPPANAIPATGNFVYLQSDPEDFIAEGLTRLYTPLDSVIEVGAGGIAPAGNRFQLTVSDDEVWTGYFQAMDTLPDLRPGYYGDLRRFTSHNPAKGGLAWSAAHRVCNTLSGWFVIDSVVYSGDTLQSITLRFEQHCEFEPAAVRGMIRWSADDTRQPTPPQNPPPANLWNAAPGTTPDTGNYVYLQSEPGDGVGLGQSYLYTSLDAEITMSVSGRLLNVETVGDQRWTGQFQPMVPFTELQLGYYNLPMGDSLARGLFAWRGANAFCGDRHIGWFVVDSVTYESGSLMALDLRFEYRCSAGEPALHGKIHWVSSDPAIPPGPVNPPPDGLWTPPANEVPASGNFVYLEGDPGDIVTQGLTFRYTDADSTFAGYTYTDHVNVIVTSPGRSQFQINLDHMSSIPRMQPGYYADVTENYLHNPRTGALDLMANGTGCTNVTGWFVVNSVSYSGETLTALDVTFEEYCAGNTVASARGRVRWSQ